ncbi:MAG: Mur ligase family protein [Coriobacteriales bacterium]|nr:Mur ligase family protein [Coriobacteriales bacterium]
MSYQLPFSVPKTTYDEAMQILTSTKRFGIQPMLESVEDMLAELGRPEAGYDCVQIAGTNGKTSTARYTAQILMAQGMRCALYTSPELVSFTERMEVQGHPVSGDDFGLGVRAAQMAGERVNQRRQQQGQRPYDITEFDVLTVAALTVYALAGVDVAVLECGMGGRWDATSAACSIKAVAVTGIGLDHMRILGDTLEKIAGEKAAIIRRGRACVLGVGTATPDSVEDVFLEQCRKEDVVPTLVRPERLDDALGQLHPGVPREHPELAHYRYIIQQHPGRLGDALLLKLTRPDGAAVELAALKPAYQAANISCAVALAEAYLGHALSERSLYDAAVSCPTPGRFDVLVPNPLVIIDACHNPQSVQTFLGSLSQMAPRVEQRPKLLCAVLADKDVQGIVRLLTPEFPAVSVTQTSSDRALSADELAGIFRAEGAHVDGVYHTVDAAVKALHDTSFVGCGSITLAGELAGLLRRHFATPDHPERGM